MEIPTLFSPTLAIFISFDIIIYVFGYLIIFRNWRGTYRPQASSCVLSLAHATPVVLLASYSMLNTETKLSFASPNTTFQNMVLEYSIAYFLIDLLHYIVFSPSDVLFIAHHLATLYVFVTCRYLVHHGAFAILALLILAEVTSPCQNTWSLARCRKDDVAVAAKLWELLSLPFYVFYSVVRGVFGPLFVYKMGIFYTSGEAGDVIPIWVWGSWMVVIVCAIFLSILWVLNLWLELFRDRARKGFNKLS